MANLARSPTIVLLLQFLVLMIQNGDGTNQHTLVKRKREVDGIKNHVGKSFYFEEEDDLIERNNHLVESILNLERMLNKTLNDYAKLEQKNEKLQKNEIKLSLENNEIKKQLTLTTSNQQNSKAEEKLGLAYNRLETELLFCKSMHNDINDKNLRKIKNLRKLSVHEREQMLMDSVASGDTATMRLLLLLNTDVNCRNPQGDTPLIKAAYNDHENAGIMLIDAGADIESLNKEQFTALLFASRNDLLRLTHHLIENGAQVNKKGIRGRTALHLAAKMDNTLIVKLLLKHGADVAIKDENGKTPIELAKQSNASRVVDLLSHSS